MAANSVQWLPIEIKHCVEVMEQPFHHRDSFDHMLIARSIAEGMRLLSRYPRLATHQENLAVVFSNLANSLDIKLDYWQ